MAQKSKKKSVKSSKSTQLGYSDIPSVKNSWLKKNVVLGKEPTDCEIGRLFILASKKDGSGLSEKLDWPEWQMNQFHKNGLKVEGVSSKGSDTVIQLWNYDELDLNQGGSLEKSNYALMRDLAGEWLRTQESKFKHLYVEFSESCSKEVVLGTLVGLDLGAYSFKKSSGNLEQVVVHKNKGKRLSEKEIDLAAQIGCSVNFARHLVNLPGRDLNPTTYSQLLKKQFTGLKGISVEIWDAVKLEKENMGLHLGVGQAADHPPCLVKISYRPNKKNIGKPVAFVGKGITYDTGGLDLKPTGSMRLMKKDMGGSAAVAGLAYWVGLSQPTKALDFYLAIAENALSSGSFRPGDILQSRSGKTVEIDNTDAEGRLVLADALDVAVTSKEKPKAVIDVATLTGAIKVSLGSDIAGFFCSDDKLAEQIIDGAIRKGELLWRMPIHSKSKDPLKSSVADIANSAGGFGGAVRAAAFLREFVPNDIPWAHFDIYAWKDKAEGPFKSSGGSGQMVQTLISYVSGD